MSDPTRVSVVGADGVVGNQLATALDAHRVVHGPGRGLPREVPIAQADLVLSESDVVFNAQGLRQRGGTSPEEFRATHVEATRHLLARLRPGTTLVHISSAAVLGRPGSLVDGRGRPDPDSFPMPAYARIKYESERVAIEEGTARGLAVVVLRPSVVCARPVDGMLQTMIRWMRRRVLLQLLPGDTRHHFCSGPLLAAVAQAVVARAWPAGRATVFTVADPFTLSNRELSELLQRYWGRPLGIVPVPARTAGQAVEKLGGMCGGAEKASIMAGVLGVIGLNVEYQVDATFDELDLDRARFTRERTLERILAEEAEGEAPHAVEHVLVVGATGGVGQALVQALRGKGKRLSLVGRSVLPGFSGWQKTLDVASADWRQVLAEVEAIAPVDAVVFVSGTAALGRAAMIPESISREILELNFWSLSRAATAAAELWRGQRRQGAFVAVLSMAGLRGMPLEAHYAASKAAAGRFLQALRFEYPESIRLDAVYPGAIATPFRDKIPRFGVSTAEASRQGDPPELTASAIAEILEGRRGDCPVGNRAWAIAALDRFSPRIYDWLTRRRTR